MQNAPATAQSCNVIVFFIISTCSYIKSLRFGCSEMHQVKPFISIGSAAKKLVCCLRVAQPGLQSLSLLHLHFPRALQRNILP